MSNLVQQRDELEVLVYRGPFVESRHRVAAVICRAPHRAFECWGNADLMMYPRSAIKPLQALPLIESGAADAFHVSDQELALACASHNGESGHVEAVRQWLQRISLGEADLECGAHAPLSEESALEFCRTHHSFLQIHNNCSGKHTGMLATAVHCGWPTRGYTLAAHPVQEQIRRKLTEICEFDLALQTSATDGCSIPTFLMPLKHFALGMAQFAARALQGRETQGLSCLRAFRAMTLHPWFVAGSDRFCTKAMRSAQGKAIVKVGAEGVMSAAIPELEVGIALKVLDGSGRAAEVAMTQLLYHIGVFDDSNAMLRPILKNWNGIVVGHLETVDQGS